MAGPTTAPRPPGPRPATPPQATAAIHRPGVNRGIQAAAHKIVIYGGAGKYLKFLEAVKNRTDQTEAIEKAYGVKVEDIEKTWKDYAARQ